MSTLITILTAFGSGVLGSGLGAVTAVIMTAIAALVGIGANIAGADYNLVNNVAFGMFLGPQVSFGPACCAAVYAWKRGYLQDSKDIFTPLSCLKKPDVLIVGGIFAVIGWYLNTGLASLLPGKADTVAITVVVISLIAKQIFGGSMIGTVEGGKKRFALDSPCWLEYQTCATGYQMLLTGATVGIIAGYLVITMCDLGKTTGNEALAGVCNLPVWAIAVICFLMMATGRNIPVFHHIGLCAAYAAHMAYDAGSPNGAILWAAAFGIAGAYAGDLLAKVFTVNGEGFVDPPSMAIALLAFFPLGIFPAMGINKVNNPGFIVIPVILIIAFGVFAFYCESLVKKNSEK